MKTIEIEAQVDNLNKVLEFIDEEIEATSASTKIQMQLDLAVEELFVNIASYAYIDNEGTATISFDYEEGTRTISIILSDHGVPYNPLEKEDPDVTLSAEQRNIGGLGILMAKKNVDDIRYEYKDGCNITTLSKVV